MPDPANRSLSRDRVAELGVSMAEDPELANVFDTRSGDGGRNRIAVYQCQNKAANVDLPDGV